MKQMIVQCQQQMTQMALLEEGRLVEYAAELPRKRGILGSFSKRGWSMCYQVCKPPLLTLDSERMPFCM